jgi:hypothetical protein
MAVTNFTANGVLQDLLENASQDHLGSQKIDPTLYPRPITSTLDSFDQQTQIDYHHPAQSIGKRPGWNTPSIAVTNESVATIKNSVATRFVSPSVPSPQMYSNVSTNSTKYKTVPNMMQSLKTDSQVEVSFSLLVQADTPTSPVFRIFRDNIPISQEYHQLLGGSAVQSLVSATYVDTNPEMKKWHVYELRWKTTGTGSTGVTITTKDKNRTFQASNLRAI